MSFKNIRNQTQVVRAVKAALQKGCLGHAFLFQGVSGTDGRDVAVELAKALFCENLKEWESCDACRPCRLITQNAHPDFMIVSPLADSEVIKINQIRELVAKANLRPFEARSKLFVIDTADAMNEDAQNAFLKTLEEPQGDTRFVLIVRSAAGLLETLQSRCQVFYFVPSVSTSVDDEAFEALKRQMLEIFLLEAARHLPAFPDLSKFERETVSKVLDFLMQYFRDVLMIQVGAPKMVLEEADLVRKRRVAQEWDEPRIQEVIEFLSQMKDKVSNKVNLRLVSAVLADACSSREVL